MNLKYHEIMRAEQRPDVYDGPNCDKHKPRWIGSAEGDMDGDGQIGDRKGNIVFSPKTFPAGTRITVEIPCCPKCEMPADVANDQTGKCECGFDWRQWTEDMYA